MSFLCHIVLSLFFVNLSFAMESRCQKCKAVEKNSVCTNSECNANIIIQIQESSDSTLETSDTDRNSETTIATGNSMLENQKIDIGEIGYKCIICHDTMENKSEMFQLDCKHSFHKGCISEWHKQKQKCPLCNKISKIETLKILAPVTNYRVHNSNIQQNEEPNRPLRARQIDLGAGFLPYVICYQSSRDYKWISNHLSCIPCTKVKKAVAISATLILNPVFFVYFGVLATLPATERTGVGVEKYVPLICWILLLVRNIILFLDVVYFNRVLD